MRLEVNNEVTFAPFLEEVVNKALKGGLMVFTLKGNPCKQVVVASSQGLCSVWKRDPGGLNLTTMHRPCSKWGTGFGLIQDAGTLALENLKQACRIHVVNGFGARPEEVVKWKSVQHWMEFGGASGFYTEYTGKVETPC